MPGGVEPPLLTCVDYPSWTNVLILYIQIPRPRSHKCGVDGVSEDAHAWTPRIGGSFRVYDNVVGEWVLVGGGDGWDVVFVAVDDVDDFHGGFLERLLHCAAHFEDVCRKWG